MSATAPIEALRRLVDDESAASLAEYAIVAVLVSIVAFAFLVLIGGEVAQFFANAAGDF